jgi:succinate-semialdehyde dehydrogenase / glutarate-semialdehyde dehydrogenase
MIGPRNPRTGAHDPAMRFDTPSDVQDAAARLRTAQAAWAQTPIRVRATQLTLLAGVIADHRGAIADALEADTGRRAITAQEIDGVIASLRGWAGRADDLIKTPWQDSRANPTLRHRAQFHPYPLVGVIAPWNFPLTLSMMDAIPALLAGCAVLVKPSEVTPRFIAPLRDCIAKAQMDDVFHIAHGAGDVGAALVTLADAVCFTGSVATGRKVALSCAQRLIPAFLELGGKDPLIILEGADLDAAATAALRGSVLATGQACQSIERIYVAKAIHDAFLAKLVDATSACRLNWPSIAQGEIGPIIYAQQAEVLQRHVQDAIAKGATLHTGGAVEHHGGGLWMRPTVLSGVTHSMLVMQEESFGPLMPVMAFDTPDQAIALANDSAYGLSAAVFADTLETAERIAAQLRVGAVSLNDAALTALFYEAEKHSFGESGLGGSRMGEAGFLRFLRRQALIANTGKPTPLSQFSESRAD